jgi:hypothetical protein
MSLITKMRRQTAVYWGPSANDVHGRPTYADPVEISCRWEDTTTELPKEDGSVVVSKAKVFVGEDLAIGGMLMLGELESAEDDSQPYEFPEAWPILSFEKIPNIKNTETLRIAYL